MKRRITSLLTLALSTTLLLGGCGSNEGTETTNNDSNNNSWSGTLSESADTKIAEETKENLVGMESQEVQEMSEQTEEVFAESVEMVEWELWASQPDRDAPCLVVWNEELGKQEIIELGQGIKYITEEGDRLAIACPGAESGVHAVYVNSTSQRLIETEYGPYYEVVLENESWNWVGLYWEGVNYDYTVKNH